MAETKKGWNHGMGTKPGCLKPVLLGCLGFIVILIIGAGIIAVVAKRGVDREQVEDRELTPEMVRIGEPLSGSGRVILDLAQGEFQIRPAPSGEGVSVKARFDVQAYELVDDLETLPDSSWIYRVRFRRTISFLQSLLRALMGGSTDSYVHVYLPPDVPITLELLVQEGGFEAEIGGLWIPDADVRFKKGGFSLNVSEPLKEPMDRLVIQGSMGGFEATRLGNASPRSLDVDCRMGGADIDMRGAWARDCDIRLAVSMGGLSVVVPEGVDVEGVAAPGASLRPEQAEVPVPLLRFSVTESMGEIEVLRR